MAMIQTPGPTLILNTTSTAATGDWYSIHPSMGRLAFHVINQPSSAGGTIDSTTLIEVSNDGVNVALTPLTFALAGVTTARHSTGSCLASSQDGHWGYIRARLAAMSTSTAASTGADTYLRVYVNAGRVGF